MKKKRILLLFTIFLATLCNAQTTFSVKGMVSNFHTSGENKNTMVTEPGLLIALEQYISKRSVALKIQQGAFYNHANQFSGFTQIHLKYRLYYRKHSLALSAGPAIFYEQIDKAASVFSVPGEANKTWEQSNAWLTGEMEYAYYLNSSWRALVSVGHTGANSFTASAGFRIWLKSKAKSCDCPSFGKSY